MKGVNCGPQEEAGVAQLPPPYPRTEAGKNTGLSSEASGKGGELTGRRIVSWTLVMSCYRHHGTSRVSVPQAETDC